MGLDCRHSPPFVAQLNKLETNFIFLLRTAEYTYWGLSPGPSSGEDLSCNHTSSFPSSRFSVVASFRLSCSSCNLFALVGVVGVCAGHGFGRFCVCIRGYENPGHV
jgi:hypothetical protein